MRKMIHEAVEVAHAEGFECFDEDQITKSVIEVIENGKTVTVQKKSLLACIAFVALALTFILFAGLRSDVNDTLVYADNFKKVSPSISGLDWSLGNNPLFMVYQITIKRFISF